MKILRTKLILALAFVLAANGAVLAQTNRVPGAEDYSNFSRFVTDRNIFDASRQPHYTSTPRRTTRPRTSRSTGAPTFTLVGTISYSKGMFAFFNGTTSDLKQALPVAESIAGYKVLEIAQGRVQLETPEKKKLELKVGDSMRQENGKWILAGTENSAASSTADAPAATENSDTPAPASNPALESNDVLKRLMEKRQKENP